MKIDAKPRLHVARTFSANISSAHVSIASTLFTLLLILTLTVPSLAQEPTSEPAAPTPPEAKEESIEHDPFPGHARSKADQAKPERKPAKKTEKKGAAAPADSEPEIEPEKSTETQSAAKVEEARTPNEPADACAGGHIVEDGIVDKGFSFVTTAKWGMYVQEVQSEDFPSRHLKEVCACWFQKPGGGKADFEVLFFAAEGSRPAMEPYAKVQATAKGLGEGKRDARWHAVDVSGVSLPEGTSYIGVRWQPTKEPRLFVCSDQSAETPRRKGFFGEDRSRGWIDLETTADPIFIPHRALMIRSVAHPEGYEPPPATKAESASATPQVVTP